MTDYELFVPLSDSYTVKDPRFPEDRPGFETGFLIVIPLYGAVPLDEDPSVIVQGKYFCSLGKTYGQLFIELSTVLDRLDIDVRRKDYNTLHANPNIRLFDVWDSKGSLAAEKCNYFVP